MKKTLTFLFAAALTAFSVSADTPEISTNSYNFSAIKASHTNAPSKAPASNLEELLGEYTCLCYDYMQENNPRIDFPITVRAGEKENEIIFNGVAGIPLDMVGYVNFEEGVIMVENRWLTGKLTGDFDGEYDIYFQHGAWVDDGTGTGNQISGDTTLPLNVLIVDGGLLFGYPNDIIEMKAYENGEFVDYFCAVSYIVAMPVYVDPYTYVQLEEKATFCDGWILPGFSLNPMDYPIEVTVERCVEIPGQYRIVDPYSNELFSEYNEGTEDTGYIVFDVTNPECVLALTGYKSGFFEKLTWGMGNFYFYNLEALALLDFTMLGQEITTTELKNLMIAQGYEVSNVVDNVVTIKNCLFGYDQNPTAGGLWQVDGQNVDMTATIVMPQGFDSLTGVEIDNNLPVEYFNLQGIKVENPESGIYIRRQGNEAVKVYVR